MSDPVLPRRFFLSGLAALPLAGGAVLASDPIFAAIEQHKAALQAYDNALEYVENADVENEAEEAAFAAFVKRKPTTLAGLRAFAEYAHEMHERDFGSRRDELALATIAEACRRLIPPAA